MFKASAVESVVRFFSWFCCSSLVVCLSVFGWSLVVCGLLVVCSWSVICGSSTIGCMFSVVHGSSAVGIGRLLSIVVCRLSVVGQLSVGRRSCPLLVVC